MTVNHRITDDKEKQRILAIGGKIKEQATVRQLALSRSFGDCPYSSFLSVEPYIYSVEINRLLHRYIVLASDGVWDYVATENECDE